MIFAMERQENSLGFVICDLQSQRLLTVCGVERFTPLLYTPTHGVGLDLKLAKRALEDSLK